MREPYVVERAVRPASPESSAVRPKTTDRDPVGRMESEEAPSPVSVGLRGFTPTREGPLGPQPAMDVQRRAIFRIQHIHTHYGPDSEALRLTNISRDVEGKPVSEIEGVAHLSATEDQFSEL